MNPLAIPKPKPETHRGNYRHGLAKSRIWIIYVGIRQRCAAKTGKNVKWYGAINCQWNTFEDFYADMGKSYNEHVIRYGEKNTTIERFDNNKDYCRDNCRWATKAEQVRNSSQTRLFTYNDKTQCMKDWANEFGIRYGTFKARLDRGWSFERASQ